MTQSEFIPMACPVCNEISTSFLRRAYDDRYGQPNLFSLVRCLNCGHIMTSPRLRDLDLGELYSTYYPRKYVKADDLKRETVRSVARWARLRRWWAGTDNQGQYSVLPGELMLDIGCGSGLSLLEAKALGADVRGVEADPNVKRIADELGLSVYIGNLLDEPFVGERFDLIVLNQVIEHVPNPGLMLDRLRSRLKKNGRVILVFPNVESLWCRLSGDRWINWHVPYHLHHFSRIGFGRMATRFGYQVLSFRTITPNLWTILQIRAMWTRVELGKPSPIWTLSTSQTQINEIEVPVRRSLSQFLRSITYRTLLMGLIIPIVLVNRIVDSLGCGDSVMIEIVPREIL